MGNSGERISEALHAKALILKSVTGNLPSLSTLPIFTFCDSLCMNILQQDFLGQTLFSWFFSVSRCDSVWGFN
jgi:hypothetical protein